MALNAVEVKFHRLVQSDLNKVIRHYRDVSADLIESLDDDFYNRFMIGVRKVLANPEHYHFDACDLRRYNLSRFPFHFLYDKRGNEIRIWVLRHDKQKPSLGTRRFRP